MNAPHEDLPPRPPGALPVVALCDPTPASINAAWRAALVARELGCPLLLLHAASEGSRAQAIGQLLAGLAGRIRDRTGVEAATEVAAGDPLREAARVSRAARMLVLGPRRTNVLRDLALGTQAERLIRLSHAPVLVVKRQAIKAYRRLLVPLDLEQDGAAVLALAASLSRAPLLEMFHALDGRESLPLRAAGVADTVLRARRRDAQDEARQRLLRLAESVGGQAAGATAAAAFGAAADWVVARTHATRADVVVLGKRPRGALASFLLGSVTQRVLAEARTDVLVVTGDAAFSAARFPPPAPPAASAAHSSGSSA